MSCFLSGAPMSWGGIDPRPAETKAHGTEPSAEGTGTGNERDRPGGQGAAYTNIRE